MENWIKSSRCDANGNCLEASWYKSSRCNEGHCLEVSWRKSSHCDNDLCLEARSSGQQVQVRNNREPGDVLMFKATDWVRFLNDLPVLSRS